MDLDGLRWDGQGLLTVVVQDRHTGEVRMVAHADQEAVERTVASGEGHFWSRSRQAPWKKGESSGNVLRVAEVRVDCDGDALLYLVDPSGPTCHTGAPSCFFAPLGAGQPDVDGAGPTLARLWTRLEARRADDAGRSYTRRLLDAGPAKIGEKLREEAGELDVALREESDARVVSEAADVTYHLLVGLLARGLDPRALAEELARRFGMSGLEEKAARGQP